jgi:hypothetical protein
MVAATEQQETTSTAEPEPSIRHLTDQLRARAREFGAYAKYLLSLQIDRLKLTATRIVIYAVLGIAALAAAIAILMFGTGLLLLGLAGLIGSFLGSFWLGATIVGFLALTVPFATAAIALRVIDKRAFAALRAKYARIRQKQKTAFGRDIKEASDAR